MIATFNYHLFSVSFVSGTGLDPLFSLFYLILMAILQGTHLLFHFPFPRFSLLGKEPGCPPRSVKSKAYIFSILTIGPYNWG